MACRLGPSVIEELAKRFHDPPSPPDGFAYEDKGLSGWLRVWQAAIFELFFHFGELAVPVLRRVAFGEYDWTQANAIDILCRLAAKSTDREKFIADFRDSFPRFHHEAQLYAVWYMVRQSAVDQSVADVVRELEDTPGFQESVREWGDELK